MTEGPKGTAAPATEEPQDNIWAPFTSWLQELVATTERIHWFEINGKGRAYLDEDARVVIQGPMVFFRPQNGMDARASRVAYHIESIIGVGYL
jgi:hypothetical protein